MARTKRQVVAAADAVARLLDELKRVAKLYRAGQDTNLKVLVTSPDIKPSLDRLVATMFPDVPFQVVVVQ